MVVVRAVQPTDGPELARAWEDARAYYSDLDAEAFRPPDPADAGLADWLIAGLLRRAHERDHLVCVAELDGQAIGFVEARLEEAGDPVGRAVVRDEGRARAHVNVLVVRRSAWRRGAGSSLMAAVEDWAQSHGAELIKLATPIGSKVAVPFYEASGFDRRAIVFVKYLTPTRNLDHADR